jgi:ATP-dependent 26S proteasome regulatory subunit
MDTNALQQLDKALIRPGRVNRILSWKPLTAESTRQLLENHFETQLPTTTRLPERVWTAAEVQGVLAGTRCVKEAIVALWDDKKKLRTEGAKPSGTHEIQKGRVRNTRASLST